MWAGLTPWRPYHGPEVQKPCVGWAERDPEVSGPAWKEGASWEEVEEAEAEEEPSEDHASSASSDQQVSAGYGGQRLVSAWEDVLEGLVPQRWEVEDQQNWQLWRLMSAGPVCRCWCL